MNGVTRKHGKIVADNDDMWIVRTSDGDEFLTGEGPEWFDLQPAEPDYSI